MQGTGKSFAAWFFDYDNDGWPDLFVASYFVSVEETVQTYLGLPHNAGTLKLYKNLGNGAFRDVTEQTALDRVFMPMGANFGDVDNDGYLDIYLGTGNPSYASVVPNVLLRNREGKSFVDITASSGTGELHKGHGVAFADIDNDGDEDIITSMGGVTPGDRHAFRLFENPGNGNDWISLRLVGTKANRAAIGAGIKVAVKNAGAGTRSIYRTVGSGGSFGASPLQQHIGLGKIGANCEHRNIVARRRQDAADVLQRGQEPVSGDQGIFSELFETRAAPVPPGGREQAMKRAALLALVACFSLGHVVGAEGRYPVTGLILKIDKPHRTFVASCSAIPGYMDAMVMPIPVREQRALEGLEPGMFVDFTLVVEKDDSYADGVRVRNYESLEQEPLLVRRLQLLERLDKANPTPAALAVGEPVPDFTLTDQTGKRVTLSRFKGKVVGVTFIYTTCPLPNYCFRLSNNFGLLQKRFAKRMGRDLILLSITFDPTHDRPEVLAKYASIWKADPKSWHFLTGSVQAVKAVCRLFGLNFWPDEGVLTHSLHTVIIDRQGKVAANFEGNEFTAQQLGDFVETILNRVD